MVKRGDPLELPLSLDLHLNVPNTGGADFYWHLFDIKKLLNALVQFWVRVCFTLELLEARVVADRTKVGRNERHRDPETVAAVLSLKLLRAEGAKASLRIRWHIANSDLHHLASQVGIRRWQSSNHSRFSRSYSVLIGFLCALPFCHDGLNALNFAGRQGVVH